MKFGVVVFPGSNCDADCFYVLNSVLNCNTKYIWHKDTKLNDFDCIVLPGGFSYGDYLRTGAIARFSPVMSELFNFVKKGKFVIGICNGFQILLESGILSGAMLRNKNLNFICKYVYIKVENKNTPFTKFCTKEILKIPIAHKDGNYYIDSQGLEELKENNQIIFRYSDKNGNISQDTNPNGSIYNIAGIINKEANVLGMMPHPERSSESILGSSDGILIFKSIIKWLSKR